MAKIRAAGLSCARHSSSARSRSSFPLDKPLEEPIDEFARDHPFAPQRGEPFQT